MDKFMSLTQLVMSVFMFLGTITWGIAHLIKGTIGLFGLLVVVLLAYIVWRICKIAWVEFSKK